MLRLLTILLLASAPLAQNPDLAVDGPEPGAQFGTSVDGAGDVDGDGLSDLLVGAPLDQGSGTSIFAGSVRVLRGTDALPLLVVYGETSATMLGAVVAGVGDVNGDGRADVAGSYAGNPSGRVRVFSGATGAVLVDVVGGPLDGLGADLSRVGDVDGDGVPDVLAGLPGYDDTFAGNEGRAVIVSGASGLALPAFTGPQAAAEAGRAVAGAGDLDLDGVPDLLVGAPLFDGVGDKSGRVWAVSGSSGAVLHTFDGAKAGDRFGAAIDGGEDVSGDGVPDVVLGAFGVDGPFPENGRMYVRSGANAALLYSVGGDETGELLGAAVTLGGDRNGDGRADPAVGAFGTDSAKGRTQTTSGLQGFSLLHTSGSGSGSFHGAALAGAGDTDGDGLADLLVGSFGHADGRGRIELYRGVGGDLIASPQVISITGGGFQDLYLDPGSSHAGEFYVVIGSQSGTSPGFDVAGVHVALNPDPYLDYTANCPTCPPFVGNVSQIPPSGAGRVRLAVPAGVLGAGQSGAQFDHAYVLIGAPLLSYGSQPVHLQLKH